MESEKVKEIKKVLECCVKRDKVHCTDCIKSGETDAVLTCRSLLKDALTLINELESENERIKNIGLNEDITVREWLQENQQLKDRIAELEQENDELYKRIMELEQDLVHADENVFYRECDVALQENKIKTEALKQFTERLKEYIEHHHGNYGDLSYSECEYIIDETLKEFIDD